MKGFALVALICGLAIAAGPAADKKKKKEEETQTLQLPRELPGAVMGETWDTRTMINRMYDRPESEYVNPEVVELMLDVKSAGLRLGALTNDLVDFHGQEWVAQQSWVKHFDVVVEFHSKLP